MTFDIDLFATNLRMLVRTRIDRLFDIGWLRDGREANAIDTAVSFWAVGIEITTNSASSVNTNRTVGAVIVFLTLSREASAWRRQAVLVIVRAVAIYHTLWAADPQDTNVTRRTCTIFSTLAFRTPTRDAMSVPADKAWRTIIVAVTGLQADAIDTLHVARTL